MAAGNLYALQNFFNVNWPAKWTPKPTFKTIELQKRHESGDYLYYGGGKPVETPVGNGWIDRKETFKFLLRSTTSGNVELMFEELKYCVHNLFYPAPFTPVSHESEVLAYYDCNYTGDGAGTHIHDHQTTWNLDFDATDPPSWVTTGALNRKNYLKFEGDAAQHNDFMLSATEFPAATQTHTAITFELLVKLVSGFYAALATDIRLFANSYADDLWKLEILASGNKLKYTSENGGSTYTLTAGYIPENKWTSIMVTHGSRGMEIYQNGICVGCDVANTQMPTGDSDVLHVGDAIGSHAGCDFHMSMFRVSNVQRLPWDPGGLTLALKDVQHGPGYYEAECEIIGSLSNIYVGGND